MKVTPTTNPKNRQNIPLIGCFTAITEAVAISYLDKQGYLSPVDKAILNGPTPKGLTRLDIVTAIQFERAVKEGWATDPDVKGIFNQRAVKNLQKSQALRKLQERRDAAWKAVPPYGGLVPNNSISASVNYSADDLYD